MNEKQLQALLALSKAGHHSMSAHFKKVAGHHEKKSSHHEKLSDAHQKMADHHEGMLGKAVDEHAAHHKAKHAFHKSMASHHEKAATHHSKMAEHYHKVSEAHSSVDAEKIAKAWDFELEVPTVTPPAPTPAPPPTTADPAAPPTPTGGDSVNKAAEQKLDKLVEIMTKFVEAKTAPPAVPPVAPTPVTDPVEKKLDTLIDLMTKAVAPAEPVAAPAPVPTPSVKTEVDLAQLAALMGNGAGRPNIQISTPEGIKTFAVPRTGDITKAAAAAGGDTSAVPDEYSDLVKTEHVE